MYFRTIPLHAKSKSVSIPEDQIYITQKSKDNTRAKIRPSEDQGFYTALSTLMPDDFREKFDLKAEATIVVMKDRSYKLVQNNNTWDISLRSPLFAACSNRLRTPGQRLTRGLQSFSGPVNKEVYENPQTGLSQEYYVVHGDGEKNDIDNEVEYFISKPYLEEQRGQPRFSSWDKRLWKEQPQSPEKEIKLKHLEVNKWIEILDKACEQSSKGINFRVNIEVESSRIRSIQELGVPQHNRFLLALLPPPRINVTNNAPTSLLEEKTEHSPHYGQPKIKISPTGNPKREGNDEQALSNAMKNLTPEESLRALGEAARLFAGILSTARSVDPQRVAEFSKENIKLIFSALPQDAKNELLENIERPSKKSYSTSPGAPYSIPKKSSSNSLNKIRNLISSKNLRSPSKSPTSPSLSIPEDKKWGDPWDGTTEKCNYSTVPSSQIPPLPLSSHYPGASSYAFVPEENDIATSPGMRTYIKVDPEDMDIDTIDTLEQKIIPPLYEENSMLIHGSNTLYQDGREIKHEISDTVTSWKPLHHPEHHVPVVLNGVWGSLHTPLEMAITTERPRAASQSSISNIEGISNNSIYIKMNDPAVIGINGNLSDILSDDTSLTASTNFLQKLGLPLNDPVFQLLPQLTSELRFETILNKALAFKQDNNDISADSGKIYKEGESVLYQVPERTKMSIPQIYIPNAIIENRNFRAGCTLHVPPQGTQGYRDIRFEPARRQVYLRKLKCRVALNGPLIGKIDEVFGESGNEKIAIMAPNNISLRLNDAATENSNVLVSASALSKETLDQTLGVNPQYSLLDENNRIYSISRLPPNAEKIEFHIPLSAIDPTLRSKAKEDSTIILPTYYGEPERITPPLSINPNTWINRKYRK